MNQDAIVKPFALLLLVGLGGCGVFSSKHSGPGEVSDLVEMIEQVHADSGLSKEKSRAAVEALQALVAPDFDGNAVSAYGDFVEAVEASEQQADKLRDGVDPMQDAADPIFRRWESDLDQFKSAAMRQRSRTRLSAARRRYEAIVDAVGPAQTSYDAINQDLRDHVLFLSHDLNPSSLAAIRADVGALAQRVNDLDRSFDVCMSAARAYVEAVSLPGGDSGAGVKDEEDASGAKTDSAGDRGDD